MGKKRKQRKRKGKEEQSFGTCSFYCKECDFTFEIEWETIFDIQEATHGYVGFHTNDTYITCPECGEIVSDEEGSLPF